MGELDYLDQLDKKDPLAVSAEEGNYLHKMVLKCRPKNVVEVGTGHGYSTAYMAHALKDGALLTTIDQEERPMVKRDIEVGGHVFRVIGTLDDVVERLSGVDFVFLDSDHRIERIAHDIEILQPNLKRGAYVVIHDVDYYEEMGLCLEDYFEGKETNRLKTVGVKPSDGKWQYSKIKTQFGLGIAKRGKLWLLS